MITEKEIKVAIIGGGAAGFFTAINIKDNYPNARVTIFEKTSKLLAKVKISGGGRCNVTNGTTSIKELSAAYPRGGKKLKKAFSTFMTTDTIQWFEKRGVPLVTQPDNCVFPKSQDSQSIIDCFLRLAKGNKVIIKTKNEITSLAKRNNKIALIFKDGRVDIFDAVVVTTGGAPKIKRLQWLAKLGHQIESPVPSLFTFKIPNNPITQLMGNVVTGALVSIQGTKLKGDGPLLITHWGMSGPAILKLSAFGARILAEKEYHFTIQVNWIGIPNFNIAYQKIADICEQHPKKQLGNYRPFALPERIWHHLLEKIQMPRNKPWQELGKKGINKIVTLLTNDLYTVKGQTKFREEFVTCGGVSLESIHFSTMESKVFPNLFFAGEVLDIDGITGGYNFQAAWTTGFIAARLGSIKKGNN